MKRSERQRRTEVTALYREGWDVLRAWAQCQCAPGECPIDGWFAELGVSPGGLLIALVLGQPELLDVKE